MALDQSGSMDNASGMPGFNRIDVLRYSAPPFVDLIPEDNALGIITFLVRDSTSTLRGRPFMCEQASTGMRP